MKNRDLTLAAEEARDAVHTWEDESLGWLHEAPQRAALAEEEDPDAGDPAPLPHPGSTGAPERTEFILSTDQEASDGDIIDQSTWKLARYRANPVVLLDHNFSKVIGAGEKLHTETLVRRGRGINILVGTAEWDLGDPDAARIAGQFGRGFRRAVSVRWNPGKVTARDQLPKDHPAYQEAVEIKTMWGSYKESGLYHQDCTLIEWSAVGVGADGLALARARARRILARDGHLATPDPGARAALRQLFAAPDEEFAREIGDVLRRALELPGAAALRASIRACLETAPPPEPEEPVEDFAAGVLRHLRLIEGGPSPIPAGA